MSDFIRREDVVEALYQAIRATLPGTFADSMSLAIAMANNLQSVESERTAKVVCHEMKKCLYFCCGNCLNHVHSEDKYCHNCGAKLDWSDNEGMYKL